MIPSWSLSRSWPSDPLIVMSLSRDALVSRWSPRLFDQLPRVRASGQRKSALGPTGLADRNSPVSSPLCGLGPSPMSFRLWRAFWLAARNTEVLLNPIKASNVSVGGSSFLNNSSPILSPSKHFPKSRLASEDITAFNTFAAKIFPLLSLLDPNIVS